MPHVYGLDETATKLAARATSLANDVLARHAADVDSRARFPEESVKALAEFPSVLSTLDQNLSWTTALGDAYTSQQQAVLDAVQVMRGRAQSTGTLTSIPQQNVSTSGITDLTFTCADSDLRHATRLIEKVAGEIGWGVGVRLARNDVARMRVSCVTRAPCVRASASFCA